MVLQSTASKRRRRRRSSSFLLCQLAHIAYATAAEQVVTPTTPPRRYLSSSKDSSYAAVSDVWLCLACALGWSVWLVSTWYQQPDPLVFDGSESTTVMGHVLQVTLGEASDGTGIPVYHALVDYVVERKALLEEGEEEDVTTVEDPLQVRKCFATRKLLEEGFANVQVLVLKEDPTTSILYEDYLLDKRDWERQIQELSLIHI